MMKPFEIVGWSTRRWAVCVLVAGLLAGILSATALAQPSNDFRAVYPNNGILSTGIGLDGPVGIGGTNYDAIGLITPGNVPGPRFTTDDDNKPLIFTYPYPCGNFGVVTVRIVTADQTNDLVWGSGDGEWVDGIEPFADRSGRYMIVGRWRHPDTNIRVDQAGELVCAYARTPWHITNEDVETLQVGIRFLIDEEVGSG